MRLYTGQPIGIVPRARRLRRDAPEPERRLLRGLREAFPGFEWRHQAPVGPYDADILCFSQKLIIEVDGNTHATAAGYDAARTAFMQNEGYRVIRFANTDVIQNLEGVLAQISFSLREKGGAATRRRGEGDCAKEKGAAA